MGICDLEPQKRGWKILSIESEAEYDLPGLSTAHVALLREALVRFRQITQH